MDELPLGRDSSGTFQEAFTAMLITAAQVPGATRFLPRSDPGAGPTSKRESKLQAEVTLLATGLLNLEREQALQSTRIAQIQQELDEIKNLLKKIAAG